MKPRQSIKHAPVDKIAPHPGNVREDLGDLDELALSIQEHGILQPLTVTEHPTDYEKYLLLAGHRRLAAACLAGLTTVPVIVRHGLDYDDAEQLVVMLVENCQRRDLNPIERGEAYEALRARGITPVEIARRTGTPASTVAYHLRLLDLPEDECEQIRAGARSASRAMADAAAQRQEERVRQAGRPVGRPKGRATTPYFSHAHPLAERARCTHRGVPKVGGVGCGPCWEQAIRDDALGVDSLRPAPEPGDHAEPDEAAVLRALDGDRSVALRKPDRLEVVRRARARGWSYLDIERITGITKVERYLPAQQESA